MSEFPYYNNTDNNPLELKGKIIYNGTSWCYTTEPTDHELLVQILNEIQEIRKLLEGKKIG